MENVKVRYATQPGLIAEAAGVSFSQFTIPESVSLEGDPYKAGDANKVTTWMELLTPTTAKVLASYHHPVWGKYAAVTRNSYGKGTVTYVGFMPTADLTDRIIEDCVKEAGLWGPAQSLHFPLIVRSGTLNNGHRVHYVFNYSPNPVSAPYPFSDGKELLTGKSVKGSTNQAMDAWGVAIIEESAAKK